MLSQIAVGWNEIEPVFTSNVALRRPFILVGRHGTCKTTTARALSRIYGEDGFRFYDATKDDLISIAGIPIPEKLAEGNLEFSCHDRSIWNAKVIVVDELTRANKENQNLWLEILEEKSCFGKSLNYECFIATMNPESYASTFTLDEALLDRFYAVIPVPELQKGTTAGTFQEVIEMSLNRKKNHLDMEEIGKVIQKTRDVYRRLLDDTKLASAIKAYVSNLMEVLLSQVDSYVSPRKIIQLFEEICGIASYHLVLLEKETRDKDCLEMAAKAALTYTLSIPLKIKPELLMQLHENLKPFLLEGLLSELDKVRIEISKLDGIDSLLGYFEGNTERIVSHLPFDEVEGMLVRLNEAVNNRDLRLLRLLEILSKIDGHEEQKRSIKGKMILYLINKLEDIVGYIENKGICSEEDVRAREKLEEFAGAIRKMPLPQEIVRFMFSEDVADEDKTIAFILERETGKGQRSIESVKGG